MLRLSNLPSGTKETIYVESRGIPIRLAIAAQIMAGFAAWSGNSRGDFIHEEKAVACSLEWADALINEYNKETK